MIDTPVKVKNPKLFLASTLLYLAATSGRAWLLSRGVRIQVQRLDLVAPSEQVVFWATVAGGNGTSYGDIRVNLKAQSVREHWKSHGPNSQNSADAAQAARAIAVASTLEYQLESLETTADQANWRSERARILKLFQDHGPSLGTLQSSSRVTMRSFAYFKDKKLVCDCTRAAQNTLCDHVLHAYLFGIDREIVHYESIGSNQLLDLKLPIGMGEYWIPVDVGRAVDEDTRNPVPFLLVTSSLEHKLFTKLGIPTKGNTFLLAEDEGLLSYILHLNDLIVELDLFVEMNALDMYQLSDLSGCRFPHRPHIRNTIMKNTAPNNPHRESWIVANVASIVDSGTCLACRLAGAGVDDVPRF